MTSYATAFTLLGIFIGFFVSTVLVEIYNAPKIFFIYLVSGLVFALIGYSVGSLIPRTKNSDSVSGKIYVLLLILTLITIIWASLFHNPM